MAKQDLSIRDFTHSASCPISESEIIEEIILSSAPCRWYRYLVKSVAKIRDPLKEITKPLENFEVHKKKFPKKRNKQFTRHNTYKKNNCRIPGHKREQKDCPKTRMRAKKKNLTSSKMTRGVEAAKILFTLLIVNLKITFFNAYHAHQRRF